MLLTKRALPALLISGLVVGGSALLAPTAHAADCARIDVVVQLNTLTLMTKLAREFNGSPAAETKSGCAEVAVAAKSSGGATTLLGEGWPDPAKNGARPVVWMPAANSWGAVLNYRLSTQNKPEMAPIGRPTLQSPLVVAMLKPMAEALGWPNTPIGYSDILALVNSPDGWGSKGHPEWGPFRLGKTNPNFSTSGLSSLIAQYYALTGKTQDLTLEDVDQAAVKDRAIAIESAVVHYGDTTLTFLCNLARADERGTAMSYVSAIAVEENSVTNYNDGNCDGQQAKRDWAPPRIPVVAIYPKEGTLFSDNPFIVLNASWVSKQERQGAAAFGDFLWRPENQKLALKEGFRPGNPAVTIGAPIDSSHFLDPKQPQTTLSVPKPAVVAGLIDRWNNEIRKRAAVTMVIDVSGSMGEEADSATGETKLDLAKRAAAGSLDQFLPDDEVELWAFTTDIGTGEKRNYQVILPRCPMQNCRERMKLLISGLRPLSGTPLYSVTRSVFDSVGAQYNGERINAAVVLTDGADSTKDSFGDLVDDLEQQTIESPIRPVLIFTIGYGTAPDAVKLTAIAEATNGHYYSATDPKTIVNVMGLVVSNF